MFADTNAADNNANAICYSDSDTNTHRYSQGNTKTTPKPTSSPDSATVEGLALGSHLRNTRCCGHSAVSP